MAIVFDIPAAIEKRDIPAACGADGKTNSAPFVADGLTWEPNMLLIKAHHFARKPGVNNIDKIYYGFYSMSAGEFHEAPAIDFNELPGIAPPKSKKSKKEQE